MWFVTNILTTNFGVQFVIYASYRTVVLNYIWVLERTEFVIQQTNGRSTFRFSQVSGLWHLIFAVSCEWKTLCVSYLQLIWGSSFAIWSPTRSSSALLSLLDLYVLHKQRVDAIKKAHYEVFVPFSYYYHCVCSGLQGSHLDITNYRQGSVCSVIDSLHCSVTNFCKGHT